MFCHDADDKGNIIYKQQIFRPDRVPLHKTYMISYTMISHKNINISQLALWLSAVIVTSFFRLIFRIGEFRSGIIIQGDQHFPKNGKLA